MLFPVYEERFVIQQSESFFAHYITNWLCDSEIYSLCTLHRSEGETKKIRNYNRTIFRNSFRPKIDIYLYDYGKQLEVLFRFKIHLIIEIFMMFWWGTLILLTCLIFFSGQMEAQFLLIPLSMMLLSVLMAFGGYLIPVRRYKKMIQDKMNEMTRLNK